VLARRKLSEERATKTASDLGKASCVTSIAGIIIAILIVFVVLVIFVRKKLISLRNSVRVTEWLKNLK